MLQKQNKNYISSSNYLIKIKVENVKQWPSWLNNKSWSYGNLETCLGFCPPCACLCQEWPNTRGAFQNWWEMAQQLRACALLSQETWHPHRKVHSIHIGRFTASTSEGSQHPHRKAHNRLQLQLLDIRPSYLFYLAWVPALKSFKRCFSAGQWWCTPLIPALGRQRQADLCELEAKWPPKRIPGQTGLLQRETPSRGGGGGGAFFNNLRFLNFIILCIWYICVQHAYRYTLGSQKRATDP
jgi:hypothetical protein